MEFTATTSDPAQYHGDALLVGVFDYRRLSPVGESVDRASGGHLRAVLARGDLDGHAETSLLVYDVPGVQARRVWLIGCGKARDFDRHAYRRVNAFAMRLLAQSSATEACNGLTSIRVRSTDMAQRVRMAAEAATHGDYRFDEGKSAPKPPTHPLTHLTLPIEDDDQRTEAERGIRHAQALAAGTHLARDLANRPANICTPSHLAEQAEALAAAHTGIETQVLDEAAMAELGMGALLAVSRGSREPARLITMHWHGGAPEEAPAVFVGKGVTFDSGGISIKPGASMDEMKYDMGGAASVFGLIRACAELELPANVIGIVPAAENLPDGDAYRPGDIVTTMSGQTAEIINTDAEGRLLLCDALTYAQRFQPDTIVDIATLTGACIVALGHHASAVLANNDQLARQLTRAGEHAGDRAWQLPLWDEYQEQLDSPFADFSHVGGQPAGTITAACFLSRFTREYRRWGHIDIAGTAWTRSDNKGATGRPVPLMLQYLIDHHGQH